MNNLHSCSAITELIDRYLEKGGEVLQVEEGVLGHGFLILHGNGLKTAIIREVYINEWTSKHSLRMYNKTPNVYLKMIESY